MNNEFNNIVLVHFIKGIDGKISYSSAEATQNNRTSPKLEINQLFL